MHLALPSGVRADFERNHAVKTLHLLMLSCSLLTLNACSQANFLGDAKKKPSAAEKEAAEIERSETVISNLLLDAPLPELYHAMIRASDNAAFSIDGLDFDSVKSQLQDMEDSFTEVADYYPTYRSFLDEMVVPARTSLTLSEKRDAIELAYDVFHGLNGPSETDDAATFEFPPVQGVNNKAPVSMACKELRAATELHFSSFHSCARLAAKDGLNRQVTTDLQQVVSWTWGRGECSVTMAAELLVLAKNADKIADCEVVENESAPAVEKNAATKK